MLDLLEFGAEGGAERYAEYAQAVAPLLERAGGRCSSPALAGAALLGPRDGTRSRWSSTRPAPTWR